MNKIPHESVKISKSRFLHAFLVISHENKIKRCYQIYEKMAASSSKERFFN